MPRYLLDIASYQGALKLTDVVRAEFTAVNFKISHGLGQTSVHPKIGPLVAEATRLRLGISTFHWLIGNHSGITQAEYAHSRMVDLGLAQSAAHVVDVEEQLDSGDDETPPTLAVMRDYVATMRRLLSRPIMLYTGRWWWQQPGRQWNGAGLTPYLHAAPNTGYPGVYPGDDSPLWQAGYGSWGSMACMQYAVEPLRFPGGTMGTIPVSKSVIRNQAVWQALTRTTA